MRVFASAALVSGLAGWAACRSPAEPGSSKGGGAASAELRGTVTVAGAPAKDAEILVVRDGKVIAAVAASPELRLPRPADCEKVTILARLSDPAGVVAAAPKAACQDQVVIDVPASRIVSLTVAIATPPDAALDWVDLKLTPRLPDVPPVVALADGATTNLREALVVRRVTKSPAVVRAIAGRWWIGADRTIDGPLTPASKNLRFDKLTAAGGGAVTPAFGGAELDIARDTQLELTLRVDDGR